MPRIAFDECLDGHRDQCPHRPSRICSLYYCQCTCHRVSVPWRKVWLSALIVVGWAASLVVAEALL